MNYGVKIQSLRARECTSNEAPIISFWQWEQLARQKLAPLAFDYAAGGAGNEVTIRSNIDSFKDWVIVPRIFKDVSDRNLSVELFGHTYPFPIGFAPVASQALFHRMGELATARAAASLGAPFILSTGSSYSMEDVATTGTQRWFQLYLGHDREVTQSLVSRAEKSGYTAIVVTPDRPEIGWRERNLRNCLSQYIGNYAMGNIGSDPIARKKYGANLTHSALSLITNPQATLSDFQYIRSITKLPVLVKGVLHPEDAKHLIERGVDGIVVSNHGGRHVDGAVAALDVLPSIVEAADGSVPVLFDGGIRHGADVLKAIALGAKMIFIGRPFVYGLAVNGERGVRNVMENLIADFDLNLGNSGIRDVNQLNKSVILRTKSQVAVIPN